MNEEKIEAALKLIDGLKYWELAYLWRFCDAGHPYFDHTLPLYKHLEARFIKFGGMSKEISRDTGWNRDSSLDVDKITRWGNENESV